MNAYDQTVMTTDEVINLILSGKSETGCVIANVDEYNAYNSSFPGKMKLETKYKSREDAHRQFSQVWYMPKEYHDIDVFQLCMSRVTTDIERQRIKEEYQLYVERGLITLLRYFVYLVDIMKDNNILWGVGRGSSVSSYILFVIGIHRINSIKYGLDIKEFLK